MEKDLASETSGNFCRVLKALVRQPAERDAKFLNVAIKVRGREMKIGKGDDLAEWLQRGERERERKKEKGKNRERKRGKD